MGDFYGAKCFRCSHILHDGPCSECGFCRAEEFTNLALNHFGMDLFDPEVRAATKALLDGKDHPLLDQLRIECSVLGTTIEAGGRSWFVADAQFDECENEVGSHLHLTLTEAVEQAANGRRPNDGE